jgi:hypothetical protein
VPLKTDMAARGQALDVRGMHHGVQQQTYRVDQDMSVFAFDLLARIVPRRINAGLRCMCNAARRLAGRPARPPA